MMTVLQVAYPLAPVGPDAVGGAEQVLAALDRAVVEAGHRSLVVASAGSRVRGELLATRAHEGPFDEDATQSARARHRRAIVDAIETRAPDVVHLHGVDFPAYAPPPGTPALATLHLPPSFYPPEAFTSHVRVCCVSTAQQRQMPPDRATLPTIPNGVDLERFRPTTRKGDHVLVMGRICPEKGLHLALDAAREAGVRVVLAGECFPYPSHRAYFDDEIAPRLGPNVDWIGAIGGEEKVNLISSARALLVPSLVAETSSLVAMEALACATPVIAFPAGALPEIVEDGVTGLLVRDVPQMAAAIAAIEAIDPAACRAAAEARFSLVQTATRYLEVYERLARHA